MLFPPSRPHRRFHSPVLACCMSAVCWTIAVCGGSPSASELRHTPIVRAVQRARPAIVNIHGQKTVRDEDVGERSSHQVNGMGTGVVLDERGYIMTNYHVVEGVRKIQVTLADKRTVTARLVAYDGKTDLAIIKINVPDSIPVISAGRSDDLMPGEPVVAVGNAYGYEHTVTRGIISALSRTVKVSDTHKYYDLIQTDASINPGNSGGPLLNIDGEMIGLNVAVRAGAQGIGFAIPVDQAMEVAAKLLSSERLQNVWHGVIVDSSRDLGEGLVIGAVDRESPAAQGGLKPGDVVETVADKHVVRPLDFERALLDRKVGEEIELVVKRKDQPVKLSLVLAALPREASGADDRIWNSLGMRLSPVTAERFRQYQSRYRGGLEVRQVRSGGPAARQGIRAGDVLVGMHVWETTSVDNVHFVLDRKNLAELSPVKFYILRGRSTLYGHLPISADHPVAYRPVEADSRR